MKLFSIAIRYSRRRKLGNSFLQTRFRIWHFCNERARSLRSGWTSRSEIITNKAKLHNSLVTNVRSFFPHRTQCIIWHHRGNQFFIARVFFPMQRDRTGCQLGMSYGRWRIMLSRINLCPCRALSFSITSRSALTLDCSSSRRWTSRGGRFNDRIRFTHYEACNRDILGHI